MIILTPVDPRRVVYNKQLTVHINRPTTYTSTNTNTNKF